MLKNIVIDLDNTIADEFGATLRQGIHEFLKALRLMDCILILWTNSTRNRAVDILKNHNLISYFDRLIFREDYDPANRGVGKDIRTVSGDLLIDDDPFEINIRKKLEEKDFLFSHIVRIQKLI